MSKIPEAIKKGIMKKRGKPNLSKTVICILCQGSFHPAKNQKICNDCNTKKSPFKSLNNVTKWNRKKYVPAYDGHRKSEQEEERR